MDSRLIPLTRKYIANRLLGLNAEMEPIKPNQNNRFVFRDDNGKTILIVLESGYTSKAWVDSDLVDDITDFFSLKRRSDARMEIHSFLHGRLDLYVSELKEIEDLNM